MSRAAAASLASVWLVLASLSGCAGPEQDPARPVETPAARRPNIVLIITDDQGWAQLGMRGDPELQTPNIDRLAADSVDMARFYASPVCAPTRASLMTGRHAYRTGVVDTWLGRAMMAPDEVTIAEVLQGAGYRTGIFGKWHLGDSHPMRPQDQGFGHVVVHRGGGIGQPSDPPGSGYVAPILFQDGEAHRFDGYVTDVIVDEALRFIDASGTQPFFAYVATNTPHSPYLVPDRYREPYVKQGLSDRDARIYGMITNIDDNVGRLLRHLDARGLRDDTIVVFMTDNGPTTERYTAGLRDRKSSTFEGGIRVPFFVRWPGRLVPRRVETPAAHIDVMPTLLDLADVDVPADVAIDGRSLVPLFSTDAAGWPDRTLVVQAHRGDVPAPYRNFAAIGSRYKLVEGTGFALAQGADIPPPALYDIVDDPGEQHDLAAERPDDVAWLRAAYDAWFADVTSTRGFAPLAIAVGSEAEPSVTLTRQDWRAVGSTQGWGQNDLGVWVVDVRQPGGYDIQVDLPPAGTFDVPVREHGGRVVLTLGSVTRELTVPAGADDVTFEDVTLPEGRGTLEVELLTAGGEEQGPWFVHVRRR